VVSCGFGDHTTGNKLIMIHAILKRSMNISLFLIKHHISCVTMDQNIKLPAHKAKLTVLISVQFSFFDPAPIWYQIHYPSQAKC
jgi:hypothetical protein